MYASEEACESTSASTDAYVPRELRHRALHAGSVLIRAAGVPACARRSAAARASLPKLLVLMREMAAFKRLNDNLYD
jgi:hypothetical protein